MTSTPDMTRSGRQGLYHRNFILNILATFIFMLNFTAFHLLPLLVKSLGGTEADIGLIAATGWIASFVFTPISGTLVGRWGGKRMLLCGVISLTLGGAGFLLVGRIGPLIYLLRVFQGVGLAVALTAGYTLVAAFSPAARRGEGYGIHMVFTLLPHAIGPWAGETAIRAGGFQALLLLAAGFGVLSLLFGAMLRSPEGAWEQNSATSYSALTFRREIWPVMGTILLLGSSFGSVQAFIPTYIKSRGIETVSFFFVTYTIVAVFVRIFLGRLSDRLGRRRIILPSLLGMMFVVSLLAVASQATVFTAAAILFGFSQGLSLPTLGALLVDRVEAVDRGRILGLYTGFFHLGIFLNTSSMGFVAAKFGYPSLYGLTAVAATAGVILFAVYDPSRRSGHALPGGA